MSNETYMRNPRCAECNHWSYGKNHWSCDQIEYYGIWDDIDKLSSRDRIVVVWDNQFVVDVGTIFGCRLHEPNEPTVPKMPFDPERLCRTCSWWRPRESPGCKMVVWKHPSWEYDKIPSRVDERSPEPLYITCYFGSRFEIRMGRDFGCKYWMAPW